VNTVVRDGSRLIGHNTDLEAARAILAEWSAGPSDSALLFGAGGGARSLLRALAERGVPTTVVSRDPARGRALAREFGARAGSSDAVSGKDSTILANATPLGTAGEELPCALPGGDRPSVIDLAYRTAGTPLSRRAREAGCRVEDGLDFLARQGALQYALWTGRVANRGLYRSVLAGIAGGVPSGGAPGATVSPPSHPIG
jgi:shikimate dehydrogenase